MNYSKFTVVIPTLNEEKNIGILIGKLVEEYDGIRILVVDDSSDNKTIDKVAAFSSRNRNVSVLGSKGRRRGITMSELEGIMRSRTRYAILMDADFQHPYALIADIAAGLMRGNKMVIGVRRRTANLELHRRIASDVVKESGRLLLALRNRKSSSDPFSGFFGIERRFLMKTYNGCGKNFFLEGRLLFEILKHVDRNTMVSDVQYDLRKRRAGVSKMGIKQGIAILESYFVW